MSAGPGGREQILDAAARVFAREGYRGATIDAILKEAGFSKGAFYWHFQSKADLISTPVSYTHLTLPTNREV